MRGYDLSPVTTLERLQWASKSRTCGERTNGGAGKLLSHWTLSQMTPGNIDVVAGNSVERVFNSGVLFVGLLFVSMTVSLFSGFQSFVH